MSIPKLDFFGYLIIVILLGLLSYAGYLSQKSIDWDVLKRLESQKLILPTPLSSPSPSVLSPTPALTPATKK